MLPNVEWRLNVAWCRMTCEFCPMSNDMWMLSDVEWHLNVKWSDLTFECWMKWLDFWMLNEVTWLLNVEWSDLTFECGMKWLYSECWMKWLDLWMLNEVTWLLNVEWSDLTCECWMKWLDFWMLNECDLTSECLIRDRQRLKHCQIECWLFQVLYVNRRSSNKSVVLQMSSLTCQPCLYPFVLAVPAVSVSQPTYTVTTWSSVQLVCTVTANPRFAQVYWIIVQ
jgi:hypothetical protein